MVNHLVFFKVLGMIGFIPLLLSLLLSGGSVYAAPGFSQTDQPTGVAAGFSRLPRLIAFFALGAGGVIAWQAFNRRDY